MTLQKCRSLAVLLLLATCSSLLSVAVRGASRVDLDGTSPFMLVESVEEAEIEGSDERLSLAAPEHREMVFGIARSAHIAEELEFGRARHRKAHFMRGPPVV